MQQRSLLEAGGATCAVLTGQAAGLEHVSQQPRRYYAQTRASHAIRPRQQCSAAARPKCGQRRTPVSGACSQNSSSSSDMSLKSCRPGGMTPCAILSASRGLLSQVWPARLRRRTLHAVPNADGHPNSRHMAPLSRNYPCICYLLTAGRSHADLSTGSSSDCCQKLARTEDAVKMHMMSVSAAAHVLPRVRGLLGCA